MILEVHQDNQQLHETTQRKQEAIHALQQEIRFLLSQQKNHHLFIKKKES